MKKIQALTETENNDKLNGNSIDNNLDLPTTNKVVTSDSAFPRAVSELKAWIPLFENKDLLFRILERVCEGSLKDFRLVCKKAAEWTISFWFWKSSCLAKIGPINLFLGDHLINNHKFKFISETPLQLKLSLSGKLALQLFYALLISKQMEEPALIQKIQRINTLSVVYLEDQEEVKIFKDILNEIKNKHQNTFINLKSLQTTEFADLTDCSIPDSIERFECCVNPNPNSNKLSFGIKVNIRNLTHIKSIKLCSVANFKIENLPKLQTLIFDSLSLFEISINRKECPKLSSIIVDGKEFFDASAEIIIIQYKQYGLEHLTIRPINGIFQLPDQFLNLAHLNIGEFNGINLRQPDNLCSLKTINFDDVTRNNSGDAPKFSDSADSYAEENNDDHCTIS